MLLTTRSLNSNLAMVLFTLLGTIFGLLGSFGTIMAIIEDLSDSTKEKLEKRNKLDKIAGHHDKILLNFMKNSKQEYEYTSLKRVAPVMNSLNVISDEDN